MTEETVSIGACVRAQAGFLARDAVNAGLRGLRSALFPFGELPRDPARVVVHLVGNIGDIVVAIPALMSLRKRFPRARLTLVTSPGKRGLAGAKDVLHGASFLDAIVEYATSDTKSMSGLFALLRAVRSLRPDVLAMLPPPTVGARTLARNMLFARLSGARYVVGLEVAAVDAFVFDQARWNGLWEHEVTRYMRLLAPLQVPSRPVRFELPPPDPWERKVLESLEGVGPFVAFCPGGKQEGHLWPLDRFGAIATRIRRETGHEVVAIGSAGESDSCDALLRIAGGGVNFAGRLGVRGTAAMLKRAALLVTNDTGPMHLAAAAGIPIAAIFASRDFAGRWYPYGVPSEVFRARLVCEQCLFASERTDHCVREISVDDVWAGCQRLLAAREPVALAGQAV
jgi:heptosyltransferase-2